MDPSQAPEVVPHSDLEPYSQTPAKSFSNPAAEGEPRQELTYPAVDQTSEKKIMGLHKSTFWLLIVLTVVVIVAAVGGGVGGSLAVASARRESNSDSDHERQSATPSNDTASTLSTTTSPFLAPTEAVLPSECDSDGQGFAVEWGLRRRNFGLKCKSDRVGGDIASFRTYSMRDCAIACAEYIRWNGAKACVGFVFHWSLTAGLSNCFLKNSSWNDVATSAGSHVAELKFIN